MEWHHHAISDIHAWATAVSGEPDVTAYQIYYNSSQRDFLSFTHPQICYFHVEYVFCRIGTVV